MRLLSSASERGKFRFHGLLNDKVGKWLERHLLRSLWMALSVCEYFLKMMLQIFVFAFYRIYSGEY